jgi:diaminopimelate decarboxylase/aspartate kinase
MGAKVLHPRCLVPASWANIPVEVHNTQDPTGPFTRIESNGSTNGILVDAEKVTRILAVTQRSGQVLINITNLSMWGEAGFLSRVFLPFGELDVSVDLVATSQYAVSLTLDHIPGGVGGDVYTRVLERLSSLGTVSTKTECAVVSVVGEHLRNALPELGKALSDSLADMAECTVHLMTQSSEDLNLSWVVDESQARRLVQGLHNRLFPPDDAAGERWEDLRPPATDGEIRRSWSGTSVAAKGDFSPAARTPTAKA